VRSVSHWRRRWLLLHASVFVLVSVLATGVWLLSERSQGVDTAFWPGFIMLLLIPLGLHAAVVLTSPARSPPAADQGERALVDRPGQGGRRPPLGRAARPPRPAAGQRDGDPGRRPHRRGPAPGDDVGGIAVHFAARVMAAAAPGEVLVSGTVHDLVAGSDYVLEDRGAHALKGIGGEWRLFAVRA
jgi:hypothetical protein